MSAAFEQKANERYAIHGENAHELVGLGFIIDVEDDGSPVVQWYELPNSAEIGEFLVDPDDLTLVLQTALGDLGDAPDHGRILWHSHYINERPSTVDIEHFPEWLVTLGMVYHVPTRSTTLYSGAGIIRLNAAVETGLATKES